MNRNTSESLARSIRIESFNSAVLGVSTLLDAFALGSPVRLIPVQQLSEVVSTDRVQLADAPNDGVDLAADKFAGSVLAETLPVPAVSEIRASTSRGADSFAAQLRRNAVGFKPRMTPGVSRPEAFAQART